MEYKEESIILRIKEVMKERGITNQKEFEAAVGVAQSTISAIFNLNRSSLPLIDAMGDKFGISKQWLLTGAGIKYLKADINDLPVNLSEMTNSDRIELLKRLEILYERHQKIMEEEQDIMKQIVELNKYLILGNTDKAG